MEATDEAYFYLYGKVVMDMGIGWGGQNRMGTWVNRLGEGRKKGYECESFEILWRLSMQHVREN